MFNSAVKSGKRELVLRKDGLSEDIASAIEDGTDISLYEILTLNDLVLSGFLSLPHLSRVGHLTSLLQLSLINNHLEHVPQEIGSLQKLRLFDISQNNLTSLPLSLFTLPSLQTLILSHNTLTDASFPPDPPQPILPCLHRLDISDNQLTTLPQFLTHTPYLAELRIARNSLSSLDPIIILKLDSLRVFEANNNQLLSLPHELASCSKLKTIQLEANPLKDRRLLKLVVQHGTHKPKAVLDYLTSRAPPSSREGEEGGKKKKKGKGKGKETVVELIESEDSEVEFSNKLPVIRVVRPGYGGRSFEVIATNNARKIRPYLVCTIIRGIVLSQQECFKEFIGLQTTLHDTVCKRRRSATVATHDLAKVVPPVTYLAATATDITMTPLGWSKEVKVQDFVSHIESNKPDRSGGGKKTKGVDTSAASLFKYLQYVNIEEMVCLKDNSETVISLPPLTNSHNTKVSECTNDLLVEVTSSESLAVAKNVMDSLVTGIGVMSDVRAKGGEMIVEQVKVLDEARQLLVLYPSRTDLLTSTNISVIRPD